MLCSVADVQRVLQSTSSSDVARITPLLEAVDEWVKDTWGLTQTDVLVGSFQVFTKYNIAPDSFVKLPDPQPIITQVVVFPTQSLDLENIFILNDGLYQLMDNGVVQLQISNLVAVPGLEYVSQRVVRRLLTKVVINYTASGIIPAPVREATALICAATFAQQAHDVVGMTMERMGSYEYMYGARGGSSQDVYVVPTRARQWLRKSSRKLTARVV